LLDADTDVDQAKRKNKVYVNYDLLRALG